MTKIRENLHCVTPPKIGSKNTPSLDTLAVLDHFSKKQAHKTLVKRAISKYYTNDILYPLIDLKNDRNKSYWNTFHCVRRMEQTPEGKCIAKYCKNRWCIVCNRIRTGILINGYLPVIQNWEELRFVTLTLPTCNIEELPERIKCLTKSFAKISRRLKRKHLSLKIIRKLEITWNRNTNKYHAHFHVLLDGKRLSEDLVKEWLKEHPQANLQAQDDREGDRNTVVEMFKYMTKMWKKIEAPDTTEEKRVLPYPPEIMDNIFRVMRNKNTIQTYGGVKCVKDDFENSIATVFTGENRARHVIWDWEQELKTWVDYETGELRT